jgi:Fe-S oxidoreductase
MPDFCKKQIAKLKKTNTIEDHNIYETYKEKGIENVETDGNDDVFYYLGCESMKLPEVVKANIEILKKAGIKFSTNLDKKVCCGAPAFSIRDLDLAKELAGKNIELIKSTGAKVVVSDCPGCIQTLTKRYESSDVINEIKTIHIVEYINQLVKEGKLKLENPPPEELKKITIHDPCLLARNLGDTSSIRDLLNNIPGLTLQEPLYNKESTHCCGWSGTLHWADKNLARKQASNRIDELIETGANNIVSACPLCELGLGHGIEESKKDNIKVLDISNLILNSLK